MVATHTEKIQISFEVLAGSEQPAILIWELTLYQFNTLLLILQKDQKILLFKKTEKVSARAFTPVQPPDCSALYFYRSVCRLS
jgi:hypothetical protein